MKSIVACRLLPFVLALLMPAFALALPEGVKAGSKDHAGRHALHAKAAPKKTKAKSKPRAKPAKPRKVVRSKAARKPTAPSPHT